MQLPIPDFQKIHSLKKQYPGPWAITENDGFFVMNIAANTEIICATREPLDFLEKCGQLAAALEVRRQVKPIDQAPEAKQD